MLGLAHDVNASRAYARARARHDEHCERNARTERNADADKNSRRGFFLVPRYLELGQRLLNARRRQENRDVRGEIASDSPHQNKGGVGPPPGLGMCDTGMCLAQNAGGPSSGAHGMGNASDAVPAQGTEAADVAMAVVPGGRAAKVAGAAAGNVASRPGLVTRAWSWAKGLFGSKGLSKEALKSIRSLEQRALEHRTKLDAFRRNPDAFDNKGFLKNAPSPEVREQIIRGRIKHLEQEIRNFEQQIERLRGGG